MHECCLFVWLALLKELLCMLGKLNEFGVCRPDATLMEATPPHVICIAENVYVPMHAYRHLKVMQGHEELLLCTLRAFWRSRGQVCD